MSTAQLFWHLAKKDLRYLRWWLAAYFVALVPLTLPRWFIGDFKGGDNLPLMLATFAVYVLFAVIQTLLVQVDARRDDGGFLISKPVSGSVLWAEKMLFWLALLVAPAVLSRVAQPLILGFEVDVQKQAWSLLNWLTIAGMIYISLLTLAMLMRNIAMLVALTVGIIAGFCFLQWLCEIFLPRGFLDNSNRSLEADGSAYYVANWWTIATLTVTMLVWYCRRRWRSVIGGGVALAAGFIFLVKFWPWSFVPKQSQTMTPPASERQREEIAAFKMECVGQPRIEFGKGHDAERGYVYQDFRVTGLPEMWVLQRMKTEVSATLASGKKLPSQYVPWDESISTVAELQRVLSGAGTADARSEPVFIYRREELNSLSDTKVTVSGTITFQLRKIKLEPALTLRVGETAVSGNERLAVLTVSEPDKDGAVRVRVRLEGIGDDRYSLHKAHQRILVNWSRKEVVSEAWSLRKNHGSAWNYYCQIDEYRCPLPVDEGEALRLCSARYEYDDEIKVPFEIPEIELER